MNFDSNHESVSQTKVLALHTSHSLQIFIDKYPSIFDDFSLIYTV